MLAFFMSLINKALPSILNSIKWLVAMFSAKKYGEIKERNKNLDKTNEIQKKQNKIAARGNRGWKSILNRMRNDKL